MCFLCVCKVEKKIVRKRERERDREKEKERERKKTINVKLNKKIYVCY